MGQVMNLAISNNRQKIKIDKDVFIVGKSKSQADGVVQESTAVSRSHCSIEKLEKGTYSVKDLCSSNGTFLNGFRLEPHMTYELNNGDVLGIADVEFRVVYEGKSNVNNFILDNATFKAQIWGDYFSQDLVLNDLPTSGITIGTYADCHVRFLRDEQIGDYYIKIQKNENGVVGVSCSNNIFLSNDLYSVCKYIEIEPGMNIAICAALNNIVLFYLSFELEFLTIGADYDMYIDISNVSRCSIGGNVDCTVRIDDSIVGTDYIELIPSGKGYEIRMSGSSYGIKINGSMLYDDVTYITENSFFEIYGYSFCVENNKLYTCKQASIITKLPYGVINYTSNHIPYPKYIRNVRQKYEYSDEEIEILAPKPLDDEEEKNVMLTLMPIFLNLIIMVVLRGMVGGGGMFVLYCGATMLVSGTISIITTFSEIKARKKRKQDRTDNYLKYISEKEDYILEEREQEKIILSHMNLRLNENIKGVEDYSNRLFEKDKTQDDYLSIRIGSGVVSSKRQISYKKEEYVETEDELADYPQVLNEKYEYLDDMPVMLNMKDVNAVGCIGTRSKLYQMAKNIILQFAITHFYKELKLFLIIGEDDISLFEWARWLQNTYNEANGMRNFMYDAESSKTALEFLYSELSRRESSSKRENYNEDYVVLVYRSEELRNHPVSEYICRGKELGFRFVFFEEYEELLHYECESRIFLHNSDFTGYIQNTNDGNIIQDFTYEYVSGADAAKVALKLGCVYVDEVNLENNLTKNITLYQLLDIRSPYELELGNRWMNAKVYETMRVPLGVKSGNEVVYLDLHEKYHGPHGLVAGTTGSGKSEIMQTYILSMATLYHPYEVGFVLIDFKGGGMANQFKQLPHLIGTITNMDGNEVERSLKSIKAELYKRQEAFAQYGVNHIDDYIKLFKNGVASIALPHLILIVDEFAELKSEYPDFMKELISTARIGRSLGIHLILATQKPSGVVNEQIWSNSKFKLCLKVQNKNDSNEVIKSPLAAEIREPGRAYLQVGNNEIFQLFQSAYSGAPARVDGVDDTKKYKIHSIDMSGKRQLIYEKKQNKNDEGETQLQAVINYISEYCIQQGISRLPDICLPPLEKVIAYTCEGFEKTTNDIVVPVGIVDDPSTQTQYIETLNLSQNNIYIMGASQSGKTNLLQSIIRGVATLYTPQEACIYIIDCASMILRNFNDLAHVGGVVISTEEEKLKNLLKLIQESIVERKHILSSKGLSSYSAYKEAGMTDIPQMIVILDNWIAFRNCYPDYEEVFINICRDCAAVGISLIVTASQANGAGYKLISNFAKRIALFCNDSGDYAYVFEGCRLKIDDIQGRAIIENKKKFYECQFYLAFDAEKEYERIAQINAFIESVNAYYGYAKVKKIPEMPDIVDDAYIKNEHNTQVLAPYEVPLGVKFDNIGLATISLLHNPFVGFVGGIKTGRTGYVKYVLNWLIERQDVEPIKMYLLDDTTKVLGEFSDRVTYSSKMTDAAEYLNQICNIADERETLVNQKQFDTQNEPLIVLAINSVDAMNQMTKDKEDLERFKKLLVIMQEVKVCILATNVPNAMVSIGTGELLKKLKEIKKYVIFENIKDIKVTDIQPAMIRTYKKMLEIGDAYYADSSEFYKLRTVQYKKG